MTHRNGLAVGLALAVALVLTLVVAKREELPKNMFAQATTSPRPGPSRGEPLDDQVFRRIARAEMPMVVNIRTESRRQNRDLTQFFGRGLLDRFFGAPQTPAEPREQITEGAGSGFIIGGEGLILTNNHVVAGATKITVALYAEEAGEEYEARVVGRDPLTDSALIELTEKPAHQLPAARLGKSADVQPGDWAMAIGNPFNLAHTVTVGVISAVGRPFPVSDGYWQDVLQTDAAINPGNSGGPLLNLRGEVVGMNTAILSSGAVGGNVGVGFAIPIDVVRDLLPELKRGTITRGRIGVQIAPVTKDLMQPLGLTEPRGALVRLVDPKGPAAKAGMQPGDVIVGFNGTAVEKSSDLVRTVARTKPGTTADVEIVRAGRRQTVRVTVEPLTLDDVEADKQRQTQVPAESRFGIALRDLSPDVVRQLGLPQGRAGALVTGVDPASAAGRAGIQAGDVILEVNRTPVRNASEVAAALKQVPQGGTALVLAWRQGQEVFITVPTRE